MARKNKFIDDVDLSESTSLTHLLDRHSKNNDIDETNVIQHSPYYSETQFINFFSQKAGLLILDLNIQNISLNLMNLNLLFIESMQQIRLLLSVLMSVGLILMIRLLDKIFRTIICSINPVTVLDMVTVALSYISTINLMSLILLIQLLLNTLLGIICVWKYLIKSLIQRNT